MDNLQVHVRLLAETVNTLCDRYAELMTNQVALTHLLKRNGVIDDTDIRSCKIAATHVLDQELAKLKEQDATRPGQA